MVPAEAHRLARIRLYDDEGGARGKARASHAHALAAIRLDKVFVMVLITPVISCAGCGGTSVRSSARLFPNVALVSACSFGTCTVIYHRGLRGHSPALGRNQ